MYQSKKETTPVVYGPSMIKIARYCAKPNTICFPSHWHDRLEILRIQKGTLIEGQEGNERRLMPGDICIIPPHSFHKCVTENESTEYDAFMFDIRNFYNEASICMKYLPAIYEGRAKLQSVTQDPDIHRCLDNLSEKISTDFDAFHRVCSVYQLLALLCERLLITIDSSSSRNLQFREIEKYIKANLAEDISTVSLSLKFGYSEEHFCRKFKESIGVTPMKFVRILRLEKAYEMLRSGEHHMEIVADRCGFHDANYFSRCFKAHYGVAPSRFYELQNLLKVKKSS